MTGMQKNRPWMTWLMACAGCGACSLMPQAGAHATPDSQDSPLQVSARLTSLPVILHGRQALTFTWTNQGGRPLLLQTHVDSDGGVMYDSIVLEQGTVRVPLTSVRKASAPRYCVLPQGQSHSVHIHDIGHWLAMLGLDPSHPWRAAYMVDASDSPPQGPMPLCGLHGQSTAPLWRGKADGPLLSIGAPARL